MIYKQSFLYLSDCFRKRIDFDGDRTIWYHIGEAPEWRHISRDLRVDLRKGIGMTNTKAVKKVKTSIRKVMLMTPFKL